MNKSTDIFRKFLSPIIALVTISIVMILLFNDSRLPLTLFFISIILMYTVVLIPAIKYGELNIRGNVIKKEDNKKKYIFFLAFYIVFLLLLVYAFYWIYFNLL